MSDKKITAPKSKDDSDLVVALARGAIGSIPVVGNIAAEVFGYVVIPAVQARNAEWMEEVSEAINRLREEKGIDYESLKDNPAFIDTFMQVSRIAVSTSDEEKRAHLRNAILNSALPECPDETRRTMNIRWIEQLTSWHIRMIEFFASPREWFQKRGRQPPEFYMSSTLNQAWIAAYPEMQQHNELTERLCAQLNAEGLVKVSSWGGMMSPSGALEPRASKFGTDLLAFIRSPLQAVPVGPVEKA